MILNAGQISETITKLNAVLSEQKEILDASKKVIQTDLSAAWECKAQKAYADAFNVLEKNVLSQVNELIGLFGKAFVASQDGLYQVDVDIAAMTVTAITPQQ